MLPQNSEKPTRNSRPLPGQRLLEDWSNGFLEYTRNSESPRMFHLWASLSTIAGALQRRCYIKWGHDTIYPNMYAILVGPSGRVRKGDPINTSKNFLKKLGCPMVGEENSPEAITRYMRDNLQNFTDRSTNKIVMHNSVSCIIEELAVLTGEQNTRFLATLTNWYDSRDDWTRRTKNMGIDELVGVCFNMLAATAPDWLPYIFTHESVGGGFTSRCLFIVEDRKSQIVANPNENMPDPELKKSLERDLELIYTMSGEFKMSPEAIATYEAWYIAQEDASAKRAGTDPALEGYMSRRATHIKKLAMVLSASRGSDYTINNNDLIRAIGLLKSIELRMSAVFNGMGSARYARETEMVLNFVRRAGVVLKSDLLQALYRHVDVEALASITRVLTEMRHVRLTIKANDVEYEYIGPKDQPPTALESLGSSKKFND